MAALSNQSVVRAGLNPAYAAAAGGGDTFRPGRKVYLHVKNGHTAAQTVTVATPGSVIGLDIADVSVSVPNAGERVIGPFPPEHFAGSGGLANITYSGVTALTIGVFELSA